MSETAPGPPLPILRLILLVPLGFVLASLAAGFFISFSLFGSSLGAFDLLAYSIVATLLLTINAGTVAVIPAAVAILLAEIFGWRSIFYYLAVGMVIGVIGDRIAEDYLWLDFIDKRLTLLIAAGFVGGFVYWALIGKFAGYRATRPSPTSTG